MNKKLFRDRLCRACGMRLRPTYANQWIHPACQKKWRRKYQRRYQTKLRRDLGEQFLDMA